MVENGLERSDVRFADISPGENSHRYEKKTLPHRERFLS